MVIYVIISSIVGELLLQLQHHLLINKKQ